MQEDLVRRTACATTVESVRKAGTGLSATVLQPATPETRALEVSKCINNRESNYSGYCLNVNSSYIGVRKGGFQYLFFSF